MGEFTIQISRGLVDRLVQDADMSKRTKRTKGKASREPPASQKQTEDGSVKPKREAWPLQPPPVFLPATSELEAIRSAVQESEKAVERLQKEEENVLEKVTQKAKELRDKEYKLPKPKPRPCSGDSEACLACYKEHVKDPLKCASLVINFADCVRRFRQEVELRNV
ncbi:uncharacterized protein LOC114734577 [Neltuma alba]|uniref:uncharacterized protein LOC114734577 n=1 Tax=Neltuma alba TaxID=207710 RepID=UPI0010A3DB3D|nr:uncharacterized protein LOC114734577 [Prosopis alba]XP_028778029.1 uncharacterized protein LOC114734577 [Prosopis alba]